MNCTLCSAISVEQTAIIFKTPASSFFVLTAQEAIFPLILSPSTTNPLPYISESRDIEMRFFFLTKILSQTDVSFAHAPFRSNAAAPVAQTKELRNSADSTILFIGRICFSSSPHFRPALAKQRRTG